MHRPSGALGEGASEALPDAGTVTLPRCHPRAAGSAPRHQTRNRVLELHPSSTGKFILIGIPLLNEILFAKTVKIQKRFKRYQHAC